MYYLLELAHSKVTLIKLVTIIKLLSRMLPLSMVQIRVVVV